MEHAVALSVPVPAPVDRPRRSATRTAELRLLIADEIVSGRLTPGTPLEEVEIAKRFGVSRTPVREALRDLAASGLVEVRPHRSALVARPSRDRLRDMLQVMADLEATAARQCAAHMTALERAELQRVHYEMAETVREGDFARFEALDQRFHTLVAVGSHNVYLSELITATRARLLPFQNRHHTVLRRLPQAYQEHGALLDAILRGDGTGAEATARAHVLALEIVG